MNLTTAERKCEQIKSWSSWHQVTWSRQSSGNYHISLRLSDTERPRLFRSEYEVDSYLRSVGGEA